MNFLTQLTYAFLMQDRGAFMNKDHLLSIHDLLTGPCLLLVEALAKLGGSESLNSYIGNTWATMPT